MRAAILFLPKSSIVEILHPVIDPIFSFPQKENNPQRHHFFWTEVDMKNILTIILAVLLAICVIALVLLYSQNQEMKKALVEKETKVGQQKSTQ